MNSAGCQPGGAARHVSQLRGTLRQAWPLGTPRLCRLRGRQFRPRPPEPRRDISGQGDAGPVVPAVPSPGRSGVQAEPSHAGRRRRGPRGAKPCVEPGREAQLEAAAAPGAAAESRLLHGRLLHAADSGAAMAPRGCLHCSSQNRAAFVIRLVHGEPADAKTPPVPACIDVRGLRGAGAGGGRHRAAPRECPPSARRGGSGRVLAVPEAPCL